MSEQQYIMAIDQGTTSSRAIIFDHDGNKVAISQQEFPQYFPQPGWVEHDPLEIWDSVQSVISNVMIKSQIKPYKIAAIGITNQRETTVIWDRHTGKPIYNAIVWQSKQTSDIAEQLIKDGYKDMIHKKTGLVIDSYFAATKIKWILDHVPGAREKAAKGDLMFGTIDTWLLWNLSGRRVHATDVTNASRTMLFNIHTLRWDEELLRLFDIPASMLPQVYPSSYLFGCTDPRLFGSAIPVCGVVGDQQAALFGQLCTKKGDVKNTYGTGCFLLMNTGDRAVKSQNGLVTTLGATVEGKPCYVLEGSVFVGGAVVQWLRDEMRIISSSDDSETQALKVKDSGGVYVVPAFTGLGAPYWDPSARGTVTGITRGTSREHIVRAALEGIAYEVCDLVQAMEKDAGIKITQLAVDGGACKNDFLMQFQADLLDCTAVRPKVAETTALGAAYLAGLNAGCWSGLEEIKKNFEVERTFTPNMSEGDRINLLNGWRDAVKKATLK